MWKIARVLISGGTLVLVLMVGAYPPSAWAGRADRAAAVIDSAGQYVSPDRRCDATLTIASMGGFLILTAGRRNMSGKLKVKDVSGIAWVNGHTLVYTASPIYGVPGVYVYSCGSKMARRIVAPKTLNPAYPNGADFFELKGISIGSHVTVYFYYASDVDKVDFTKFRIPAFLFQVHLDGTGFHRVAER